MTLDELEALVAECPKQPSHAQRVAAEDRAKMALYHRAPILLKMARLCERVTRCADYRDVQMLVYDARALMAELEEL